MVFNLPAETATTACEEAKRPGPRADPSGGAAAEGSDRGKPIQNVHRLLDLHKRHRRKREKEAELKGRGNVLTPRVLWCQSQVEVEIKILAGSVEDYSLECTVGNLSFRCFSGAGFYAVDLKLYGAVDPGMTRVAVKAFHVGVVLTKLASPPWPRLHADEGKLRWISLDVESLAEREGVFSEKIKSAKLEIESGMTKEGIRNGTVRPCSDSDDEYDIFPSSEADDEDDE